MNILQITKKFPFPLKDGEAWAVLGLAKGLKEQGCTMSLFSMTEVNWSEGRLDALEEMNIYQEIHAIPTETSPGYISAIINLFSQDSYHAVRFDHGGFHKSLGEHLEKTKYDIIICETVYMLVYADLIRTSLQDAKILVRTHNIEHMIWQRYASQQGGIRGSYYGLQGKRLEQYEINQLQAADGMLAISQNDLTRLKEKGISIPSVVCPIGISDNEVSERSKENKPLIIGALGSMDWRPNLEGLTWFLNTMWSDIQKLDFESRLIIAGKNFSGKKMWLDHPNVTFMGEIDDSDSFLQQIDVLIVPLLSGSGTRVKILQAFRNLTPVLSTTIGAEGLDITHEEEAFISDKSKDWLYTLEMIQAGWEVNLITSKANQYFKNYHDPNQIAKKVVTFIEGL